MPTNRPTWGKHCTWGDMVRVTFSNGTKVTVNSGIADLVKMLGDETIARGYRIRSGVTGGYNCRAISGTNSYSNHAWGLAIDINWDTNPWRRPLTTDMPKWMIDLWVGYGFRWGGTYSKPDAMHYEFMGTRSDAAAQTNRARANGIGSGTAPPPPTGAHRMTATRHRRLYDSRKQGGKVRNGQKLTIAAPSSKPSWAQAVLVNVTLLDVDGPCHAESIWTEGSDVPSIVNNDGGVFANANMAAIPFNGNQFTVKLVGGPAHVLVDFQGWAEANL